MTQPDAYYISGPMRGIPCYNFPMFDLVASIVRGVGFIAINPADHDREVDPEVESREHYLKGDPDLNLNEGANFHKLLGWDLVQIAGPECKGIIMLPGWENSTGAQHERYVAEATGKQVFICDMADDGEFCFIEDHDRSLSAKTPPAPKRTEGDDIEELERLAAKVTTPMPTAAPWYHEAGLPTDREARKGVPMARGLLDYFPDACAEVAHVSFVANEQHNPGEPMHWAKEKSTDHADCIVRHLVDRGTIDTDGLRHSAKVAWRGLALLQIELDAARRAASNEQIGY